MISIQQEDFDLGKEYQAVRDRACNAGAIVTFTGLVREIYEQTEPTQAKVEGLYLEHYPGMTEKSLADIAEQACQRWDLQAWRIIHRVGALAAHDQIVLVATASAHRGHAFAAAEFMMDYLKSKAPFWKKQTVAGNSQWIEARDSDIASLDRWKP